MDADRLRPLYLLATLALTGCDQSGVSSMSEPTIEAAVPTQTLPSGISTWEPAQVYPPGRIVQHDDKMFVSVKETSSGEPMTDSEEWVLATGISMQDVSGAGAGQGLVWQGDWIERQIYSVGNAVAYEGQSYISIADTKGV